MGVAPAEPASLPVMSPQLQRQRSLASAIAIRCCSAVCCYDCDNFFTRLPASSSSREIPNPTSQQKHQQLASWHDSWRLLGSRRKAAVSMQGTHDEAEAVLSEDLYMKPTRWRLFFRKLRAETRKMNCSSRPSPAGFQYDALSYAMNFDDSCCSWQQQQQQQSLYRASSPSFMETLPSSKFCISSTS